MSRAEWAPKLPRADSQNGRSRRVDADKDGSRTAHGVHHDLTSSSSLTVADSARSGPNSSKSDSPFIPSSEEEFRSAIDALNSSTRTIERRTKILAVQQNHAKTLASSQHAIDARRAAQTDRASQKQAAELQHLKFANAQLFESLREDLRTDLGRVEKEVKAAPTTVWAILKSDDHVLAELDELSATASTKPESKLDVDVLQQRVEKLTRALQYFRAEALKDRLDRIYLEALNTADVRGDVHEASGDLPEVVEADLSSLYTEIDDMVTMVVAHEHGDALNTGLQNARRIQMQEKRTASQKIYGRLCSLTVALDALSSSMETLQLQRHDLRDLDTHLGQIDGKGRSRTIHNSAPARTEEKYIGPATQALLQYLNLSTNTGKSIENRNLNGDLDNISIKLEQQSTQKITHILHASEQAATNRRAVLQSISDALATNDADDLAVKMLEEKVASVKVKLEEAKTR